MADVEAAGAHVFIVAGIQIADRGVQGQRADRPRDQFQLRPANGRSAGIGEQGGEPARSIRGEARQLKVRIVVPEDGGVGGQTTIEPR
ncbi:hypothetical protein D3C80_1458420 [compost metagenome]